MTQAIQNKVDREKLLQFEDLLKGQENVFLGDTANCPLKHSFADGIYVREIFIPEGTILTGKIHKHAHPNFLMSGTVDVVTEHGGHETLSGPLSMISKAGTKRIVYALTDTTWITVHHNKTNTTDLVELEKIVIAESYNEYEKFLTGKGSFVKRIGNYIKKQFKIN